MIAGCSLGRDVVVRRPELLVELLARPGADDLDRDVSLGLPAGQADHLPGELEDLDRLAHVEHEDLGRDRRSHRPEGRAATASGIVMK